MIFVVLIGFIAVVALTWSAWWVIGRLFWLLVEFAGLFWWAVMQLGRINPDTVEGSETATTMFAWFLAVLAAIHLMRLSSRREA